MKRAESTPWIFLSLLLLTATSLSFLDRQVLSVSIIKIRDELSISDVEYGIINSGFLISYAIMFTLGGVLIDRFGSRWGLGLSVAFWSVATMLHSLASSVLQLGFFRFLLGLGEGGCFPGAVRAVIEKVPERRHAMANGIAIGGSALGAVIAPPLCAWLLVSVGWRSLFIITGGFGLLWFVVWLLFTAKKNAAVQETGHTVADTTRPSFLKLISDREALTFIIIRFVLDPIFYFYMFWIPKYLNESRNMSLEDIGGILWLPFLALGAGNFLGGWSSDNISRLTGNSSMARKGVMGLAALLTIPVLFVGFLENDTVIILFMTLAFFAHGLWITNYITSISDIFGKTSTSTVVGLSGSAGAISALVLNPVIGLIVSEFSYKPLWWYAGLMYPVAFVFMISMIPEIKRKYVNI